MPTKKQSRKKPNNKSYEQFLHDLKLLALGLNRSLCDLDRAAYYDRIDERRRNATANISATYRLVEVGDSFFDATATFTLKVQDEKTQTVPLTIECVFETHFHGKQPIDKALAKKVVSSELRVVIWPYFRQFVSDMTTRMAVPQVTVPLSVER